MLAASLRFFELQSHFKGQEPGKPFPVKTSQLTEVWHCTPRYVKKIVHHLHDAGWIDWKAGQGRGNSSVLTLITHPDEILLDEAKQRIEQGQVPEAMELMNRYGTGAVKDRLIDLLSESLGFSTKTVSDQLQETLRLPVYREIYTLDPGLTYYAFDHHLAGQLFNTLVKYDRDSRTIRPCIAHSWETSRDGLVWTFHLRKGVMFHHGRELNAEDAIFSLNRIRLNSDRYETAWRFRDIERMEAIDPKTLRIWLREPNSLFLRILSTIPASILPADLAAGGKSDYWAKPSGTGPFRLAQLNEGLCVLEAFQAHFQGRPHLDRVEVLILPDLEAGSLKEPDWTSVMSSQGDATRTQLEMSYEEESDWRKEESLFGCSSLLVFNQWKNGPQNDPLFRRALYQIIDREQLIAELGQDRIYPAHGFRPHQPRENWDASEEGRLSDLEIRELLAASNYKGEIFRLSVNSFHQEDAAWIEQRLKPFGIQVRISVEEYADPNAAGESGYDGRLFGATLETDEVGELEVYLEKGYFLPAYDENMLAMVAQTADSVFREPDERKRKALLRSLENRIKRDHIVLFLAHKKSSASFHKSVRGVSINEFGWLDFDKIWFYPFK